MPRRRFGLLARSRHTALAILSFALVLAGCHTDGFFPAVGPLGATSEMLALLGASGVPADVVSEAAAGGDFDVAQPVPLPEYGRTQVRGRLEDALEVDVYVFGPLRAGDALAVDLHAPAGDTRAALFDGERSLLIANDDRDYYGGQRDPYLQVTLRRDCPQGYLVIATSRSASISLLGQTGTDYTATISRAASGRVPPPAPQVVWIELNGGRGVRIAGEPPQDVPPFNAAAIDARLASDQGYIIDAALALLADDYAAFNVTLLRSDRDARPADAHSVLYLGGFSPRYLGLADSVDWFNADPVQEAIVYVETLALFQSLAPTADEVAQAVANVAAHELGHLLGLDHTREAESVMSEAASALALLQVDAGLTTATLSSTVCPIGYQNARQAVSLAVGLRDPATWVVDGPHVTAQRARRDADGGHSTGEDLRLDALGVQMCSQCRL